MKDAIYPLRPHHGLCLGFFRGKGYSGAFVANMERMKALLEQNAMVRLTDQADCICSRCPNRTGDGSCITAQKVGRYDRAVLEQCGLEVGRELSYRELRALVEQNILAQGNREKVCGDCQWSELCR